MLFPWKNCKSKTKLLPKDVADSPKKYEHTTSETSETRMGGSPETQAIGIPWVTVFLAQT